MWCVWSGIVEGSFSEQLFFVLVMNYVLFFGIVAIKRVHKVEPMERVQTLAGHVRESSPSSKTFRYTLDNSILTKEQVRWFA